MHLETVIRGFKKKQKEAQLGGVLKTLTCLEVYRWRPSCNSPFISVLIIQRCGRVVSHTT